jgi:ankyrin repeat protein
VVSADRSLRVANIEETVEVSGGSEVQSFGGAIAFVAPEHPFVRAAQEDDLETLAGLISGMDVNLRDPRSKTTALEHAVRNANREMVQLLLSSGAKVNLKNSAGQTVLMMLDADATSDLMWDLINAGAKVNLKDDGGSTALMQAATANNLEALKALLDAGAELNTKNKGGRTALMLAASEGHVNIVRNLVLAGADINLSDEDKMNALAHALENDHAAVVRFLKSKGAVELVEKVMEEEE